MEAAALRVELEELRGYGPVPDDPEETDFVLEGDTLVPAYGNDDLDAEELEELKELREVLDQKVLST